VTRATYLGAWRIDLDIRDGVSPPIPGAALARAIAAALTAAGAPSPASVGLILTDDAELAGLNAQHLATTGPTDVLSFPLLPPEAFPDHPGAMGRTAQRKTTPDFPLPPGRRPHLGDIVVSVERATAQAVEGRGGQTGGTHWSPADELRLLVTHGALHLCGWDHADPVEETAMRALERRLLG
jgi:probable rRNA maturation factor